MKGCVIMNNGSQKAKDKYLKEKVDTFVLRVPKGEKEKIQKYAQNQGKSLNSYILDLIKKDMPSLLVNTEKTLSSSVEKKESAPVRRSSLPSFLD